MFIGRENELAELNKMYKSKSFEMPIIYGRRRVGKTRLISEFIQNKNAIYVQARRTNADVNLEMLSQAIMEKTVGITGASFKTFDEAFNALASLSKNKRLVVVIDEFPYLAQAFPEICSLLQEKIDHLYAHKTKLMLILCGSSLSFMEEQILGYESPLYGRRTAQLKIEPLNFFTTLSSWKNLNIEDAALYYGITGGVPAYIEKIDVQASLQENIEHLFLKPSAYLYEEPTNLLMQECRNPEQYDAIVQAMASGRSKISEISSAAGIPASNTKAYINKLISLGIVVRDLPLGETSNKKALYCIADQMFRFWYRFIPQNMGLIENNMPHQAYSYIEAQVSDYMGAVFELICKQFIYVLAKHEHLELVPALVGRWWGTDKRTSTQEEIDIIAQDRKGAALFAECKWRNEESGAEVLKMLVNRSELFQKDKKYYALFAKRGFTSGCKNLAQEQGNVSLFTFEEMCSKALE